jgi:hypothetical protein
VHPALISCVFASLGADAFITAAALDQVSNLRNQWVLFSRLLHAGRHVLEYVSCLAQNVHLVLFSEAKMLTAFAAACWCTFTQQAQQPLRTCCCCPVPAWALMPSSLQWHWIKLSGTAQTCDVLVH